MHVLMIDDHAMFLQGLQNLLRVLAPKLRVDVCGLLSQAVERVNSVNYDLVLLDWHLAECDGETSLSRLRDAGCMARIVILSGETSAALVRSTVDLGAAGFIPKTYSSEMMVSALDKVLAGHVFLPTEALSANRTAADGPASRTADRLGSLTPRQFQVYRAATRGLPNKLIARELGIAESTVKAHLTAIFAALGVSNRTEATYQASRSGNSIA